VKAAFIRTYVDTTITCNCGKSFTPLQPCRPSRWRSCSKCHPFFTGKQRFLDTAGRVERFQQKYKRRRSRG